MASTDARPVPIKNTAFRAVFPILDADGDLVTGATGLDSEVSKDQGTFADCTSEATEIATSSGMYYLDLTATEMNADCVAVIVKTSSSGAKTTVLVFYPQESGDIKVDVQTAAGTAWNSGAITPTTYSASTGQRPLDYGTAQGGGNTYIDLSTGASASDDYYNQTLVVITGGTGSGQAAAITDYTGSSRRATVDSAWTTNPDNTSTYAVFASSVSAKGAPLSKFSFLMTDSTNHNPATGKTVTATISKDGSSFAALNSGDSVTEIGNGIYEVDLNATDMNANIIILRFTATGCDDCFERIITTI